MQILGHRGRPRRDTPENTLAAVDAAFRSGADGVELDVRLTGDGVAVCCHDADLERVAGIDRRLDSLTLAQLAGVRVQGHAVPTVAAAVAQVAGQGSLILDLKPTDDVGLLGTAVVESLAALPHTGCRLGPVISSTEVPVLRWFAAAHPELERAAILCEGDSFEQGLQEAVEREDRALHLPLKMVFAEPDAVRHASAHGLAVRVWTVNRVPDAQLLTLLDVAALITDVPGSIRSALTAVPIPVLAH